MKPVYLQFFLISSNSLIALLFLVSKQISFSQYQKILHNLCIQIELPANSVEHGSLTKTNSVGIISWEHINPYYPRNCIRSGFCFNSWSETVSSKKVDLSLFHDSPSFQHTNGWFFFWFFCFSSFSFELKSENKRETQDFLSFTQSLSSVFIKEKQTIYNFQCWDPPWTHPLLFSCFCDTAPF